MKFETMRIMKTSLIALAMCMVPALAIGQGYRANCQASATARALCDAEAALTEALRRNDVTKLSEIYADEFQLINYRGRRVDRAAVIAAIRSGALRFDSLATSELHMRIYGGAGVITGLQHQVARGPGVNEPAHPKDVLFTHVYVLRSKRWRLVASQITPILSAVYRP